MPMTRKEHLDWCKQRANEYLDRNDPVNAVSSMFTDLAAHPETENHIGIQLGMMKMMGGHLSSVAQVKEFIDGFN